MRVHAEFQGFDEALGKLDRMGKYAPKAVKNVMRRVATLRARAIKSNIRRSRTGLLAKSIGSKVSDRKRGRVTAVAGPRAGFKTQIVRKEGKKLVGLRSAIKGRLQTPKKIVLKAAAGVDAGDVISATRYAHLADKDHRRGKGGKGKRGLASGMTRGQHFMERAAAQTDSQSIAMIRDAMREVKGA